MPSINITFDSQIIEALIAAGSDDSVSLSVTIANDGAPSPTPAPAPARPRGPLAPLLQAGLLKAGDRLRFEQPRAGRTAFATVRSDGRLSVDGKSVPFTSPSKAASAVTGSQINGWTAWHHDDGRTLAQLRDELEESEDE